MTLDAEHWAWNNARSRGNARLVVLAVADKTTGPDATARLGVTEAIRRLGGVGKGTAIKALADAVASGDLEIAEPAKGSRAATYRIPGAVNYARRTGLESGPQTPPADRSGIRTTNDYRSGIQTTTAPATGPETRPVVEEPEDTLWSGFQTATGPDYGPHHSPREGVSEGGSEGASASLLTGGNIPAAARPLVDRITASGVVVRWDLAPAEWFVVDALIKRSGVDMLAAHAVKSAGRREVAHARYFLRTWQSLPPAPAEGTAPAAPAAPASSNVIPFGAAPRRGRAAESADHLAAALAAMEAQQ